MSTTLTKAQAKSLMWLKLHEPVSMFGAECPMHILRRLIALELAKSCGSERPRAGGFGLTKYCTTEEGRAALERYRP